MDLHALMNRPIFGTTLAELVSLELVLGVLGNVASATLIVIVAFMLSGWAGRRIRGIGGRNPHLDITLFNFLGNIVRYAILAFAALFVLNTFGVTTTSIVAVIGAAGLAIGLALQGTLSNVAAGVMIVLFRPIKVGDFVVINGQMGSVKDITLNFTELADLQNIQIIIPNSEVWGNTIVNYSAYETRRIQWVFGVGYGANLARAQAIILDTIMADDRALRDPEPFIQVTELGEFSVNFTVRVWCRSADAWAFQTDCTRRVKEALDDGGIEIPFPTRTVYARPAGGAVAEAVEAAE